MIKSCQRGDIMSDINEIIKGGYDLHVHSAPDCLPRKMDDIEIDEIYFDIRYWHYCCKGSFG